MNYGDRLRDGFSQWRDDEVPDVQDEYVEAELPARERELGDYDFRKEGKE